MNPGPVTAQTPLDRARRWLTGLPRLSKRAIMAATDLVVMPVALWGAFALRLGEFLPAILFRYWWLLLVVPLVSIPALHLFGMYRSVIRFMGTSAVVAVLKGAALSAVMFAIIVVMLRLEGIPRSSYFLYWLLLVAGLSGTRFAARMWLPKPGHRPEQMMRVLIYGAGMAGIQLADMLNNGQEYRPVAFIDDDTAKQGTEILGLRVETPERIERLIQRHGIEEVLLALPTVPRARRREIVQRLEALPVHVRTVPGLVDIVAGHAKVDELREVEIDDVLGREPVAPDVELLDRCIHQRGVMVTGAGGSIGSELCRQILEREPRCLVLYESCEFMLYRVERELQALVHSRGLACEIVPVLGTVLNGERIMAVMRSRRLDTVYHAAAYKHVPLVEANPAEGVRNNVFGTLVAVRAAIDAGVKTFVLVSTDKAVHPTSVMGASKRVAELILQGLAAAPDVKLCLSMVRFGNVLDSSGSVVPVFREQIRQGGPVTVTDPEVNRFFMTIPEASQLVLQAGSMGEGGDVFVLDMGKPVRILDLARRMVHLSGLTVRDEDNPYGDIDIEFTGLRPGEKLYEELLLGEGVQPTRHPMIMRATESHFDWHMLEKRLEMLDTLCTRNDEAGIRRQLGELVDGYEGRPTKQQESMEEGRVS